MTYWPWWLGGAALASIAVAHWLVLHRLLAVSGRYTALVERLRRPREEVVPELSRAEMLEALRAATADAFGDEAVDTAPQPGPAPELPARPGTWHHVAFVLGLVAGGAVVALLTGGMSFSGSLGGEGFSKLAGATAVPVPLILVFGGMLVGFGTRMAGGCTSGHGLCGVARFQPGSLAATAAFFGAGIAASLIMEVTW